MDKNWSDEALAAIRHFPWQDEGAKLRAVVESELVAFGDRVEFADLPAAVRKWAVGRFSAGEPLRRAQSAGKWWEAKSLVEALDDHERRLLTEVLEHFDGNVSAAARAIRSTGRIVRYKAERLGLECVHHNTRHRSATQEIS